MTREPVQTEFRFRPFTEWQETAALGWWAHRIAEAEILTRNPEATQSRAKYESNLTKRLHTREDSLKDEICEEWLKASREGTLAEPVWPQPTARQRKAMGLAA